MLNKGQIRLDKLSSSIYNSPDLEQLDEIDWDAVEAVNWQQCQESKQAEFLVEQRFSWELVSRIGVFTRQVSHQVAAAFGASAHRPHVEIRREWYYSRR